MKFSRKVLIKLRFPISVGIYIFLSINLTSCSSIYKYIPSRKPKIQHNWDKFNFNSYSQTLGWKVIGGENLESLIEKSLTDTHTIKVAQLNLERANAKFKSQSGLLLPEVSLNLDSSRQGFSKNSILGSLGIGTINQFSIGAALNYEVDLFGVNQARIKSAQANRMVEEFKFQAAKLKLAARIANLFVDYLHSLKLESLINKFIDSQKNSLKLVNLRMESGNASELDLAQAKAELASISASSYEIASKISALKEEFAAIFSLSMTQAEKKIDQLLPDFKFKEPSINHLIPASTPSDVLRNRPDIKIREFALIISGFQKYVATYDLFPRFSLGSSIGVQSLDIKDLSSTASKYWSLTPNINVPIFSRFKLEAEIDRADAKLRENLLNYEQTVLTCLNEVEQIGTKLMILQKEYSDLKVSLSHHENALNIAKTQFQHGFIDYQRVLESQRNALATEQKLVQTSRNFYLVAVKLLEALGSVKHS